MHLAQAIDLFLTYKLAKGLSTQTIDWYRHNLTRFAAWLGDQELAQITSLSIALWLAHERQRITRMRRPPASTTIAGNYRSLSAFFNWCETALIVGRPPSPIGHGHSKQIVTPITDTPNLDYVHYLEYKTLTDAIPLATWLDYRDWCLISTLFWCGLRSGELLAMQLQDLALNRQEARIRHTKTRTPRPAFLIDDLTAGLITYLTLRPAWPGPELWLALDKARTAIAGPLSKTGLRLMLRRRCRRAGIRPLHPHLFRHGFAMEFLNNEADLKVVSTLLGHSNVKTTERHYARWLEGPLRRVHQRIAARISGSTA